MLVWSPKLYMDASVAKRPEKYRRMLERHRPLPAVYCITLPVNEENSMEIYSSREFWFQYNQQRRLVVIGMARSRREARKLVTRICEDVYRQFGDLSAQRIHAYFSTHAY